jgi:hypothetical protein
MLQEPRNRLHQLVLPEPIFVNVSAAKVRYLGSLNVYKSGLRRAGMITLFVVLVRQAT